VTENKLFIGIPNTGSINTELAFWLLKQKARISMPQAKPHDHCRNVIANEFLATDCTHLLMVDSDVVPPNDVVNMIDNDVPVCSAYARVNIDGELIPIGVTKNENGYHHDYKHSKAGLHKVDAVGTGCILIKREVFEQLERPFFRFQYDNDGILVKGEDFAFTERVKDVYFDSRYKCKHYTTVVI
jgi:hypothetical protein